VAGKETGELLTDFHVQIGIEVEQGLAVWIEVGDGLSSNPFVSDRHLRPEVGNARRHSPCEALAVSSYKLVAQRAFNHVPVRCENSGVVINDHGVKTIGPTMMERGTGSCRASPSAIIGKNVREIVLKIIGAGNRSAPENRRVTRVVVKHGSANARTVA
jgi:hypothetical protein